MILNQICIQQMWLDFLKMSRRRLWMPPYLQILNVKYRKGMCIIFSVCQDFGGGDAKSLIKAKNESVQIALKMKSCYEYHI